MLIKIFLLLSALVAAASCNEFLPAWGYECHNSTCIKTPLSGDHKGMGWTLCRMLCGDEIGTLWPMVTGTVKTGVETADIDCRKIEYDFPSNRKTDKLWKVVKSRFRAHVFSKIPESYMVPSGGSPLEVRVTLNETGEELPQLTYDTDESYSLRITRTPKQVLAQITAATFFGARHGMETLLQLIVYDDIGDSVRIMADAEISDAPKFKHRGLLLDTGRNYFSVRSIKRTIDAMAMSKMNVFHWHVTDVHSFPLVVQSRPNLHNLGAYSPRKVYTARDIADVVEFARSRGVRVIPEFGGPARVGEGWQGTNLTVCFNAQPWNEFCSEPPCGQFDPTNEGLYDVLEDIYRELLEAFGADILHMGGDKVSVQCWNSSAPIREWMSSQGWGAQDSDFLKLWDHFQTNALSRVDKVTKDKKLPIILWTSWLTQPSMENFDTGRFIIQTSGRFDDRTRQILKRGFRVILTTTDLYVNSRAPRWNDVGGLNGWRKFYVNRPYIFASVPRELILGSEAIVWSHQIDEVSLDTLLWPKASALAERLWSYLPTGWQEAESRLRVHREMLLENQIGAESLEPEWCIQNTNECKRNRKA